MPHHVVVLVMEKELDKLFLINSVVLALRALCLTVLLIPLEFIIAFTQKMLELHVKVCDLKIPRENAHSTIKARYLVHTYATIERLSSSLRINAIRNYGPGTSLHIII